MSVSVNFVFLGICLFCESNLFLPSNEYSFQSVLNIHWKDWCWIWNCNTLATWCKELTHWKRPWCWERLKAGGEGDDRGWDGWVALRTQWAWVWVNSRSCWWTGRPGVLQSMVSQRVGHDWVTELNWFHYCLVISLYWLWFLSFHSSKNDCFTYFSHIFFFF